MKKSLVSYVLGWVLVVLGAMLIPPIVIALIYRETEYIYFGLVAVSCLLFGLIATRFKPKNAQMNAREGFIACSLTWILMSVIGCLPLWISGQIPRFIDALFESVSGFTTTGATILGTDRQIEDLSKCMLFWRSFTNWAGGMGILVFLLAVITPLSGQSNMYLMKAESPGPVVSKLIPKLRGTAGLLYIIYTVLTGVQFLILLISGMNWFEALTVSFSTAGTGGLSVRNEGIMAYDGHYFWQAVITAFMFIFAINFSVYYLIIIKKFKQIIKIEELHWYFGIYVIAVLAIGFDLMIEGNMNSQLDIWHHTAFQVGTFISSTGFATYDFDTWPEFSKMILLVVAFIGACAGSTGGGFKVSRIIILVKSAVKEFGTTLHPNSVKNVKIDGKIVKFETIRSVHSYLSIFIFIYLISVLIISVDGFDFETNFTAVLATINNMGPGLNLVGPTRNFYDFSIVSKLVLIFDMLAGRLELLPILFLFDKSCWKSK